MTRSRLFLGADAGRLGRISAIALMQTIALLSGCDDRFFVPGVVQLSASPPGPYTQDQTVTLNVAPHAALTDIERVEFYRAGEPAHCVDREAPFSCTWTVDASHNGTHTWFARAFLTTGGHPRSQNLELTVAIEDGDIDDGSDAPPRTSPPLDEGLIGWVPGVGAARDVVLDPSTNLAYVASSDFGMSIVDISDPSRPVVVASTNESFRGSRIARSGDVAVVVGTHDATRFIDVSDPMRPRVGAPLPGIFRGVAMSGHHAYLVEIVAGNPPWAVLHTFDARDPYDPVELDAWVIPGLITTGSSHLDVVGNLLYLACTKDGLHIVDISNPGAPRLRSSLDTPDRPRGVVVRDNRAYIADGSSLVIADVSDPDRPMTLGSHPSPASSVAVSGTTAYVLRGDLLMVLDVSDASAPVHIGTGVSYSGETIRVHDGIGFVATTQHHLALDAEGLVTVDLRSERPNMLGTTCCEETQRMGIGVDGELAIVSGLGVEVYRMDDPTLPEHVATWGTAATRGGVVVGQTGYVLELHSGRPDLVSMDLSNPRVPRELGRVSLGGWLHTSFKRFVVAEGLAYVPTSDGLMVVDISDPTDLEIVGSLATPGQPTSLAVTGSTALLADVDSLLVIDVSDPTAPSIITSLLDRVLDIVVSDGYAYALGSSLHVLDIRVPSAPTPIAELHNHLSSAIGVIGDDVALIRVAESQIDLRGSVILIDVSDKMQPAYRETVWLMNISRNVAVSNGLFLATDNRARIGVVRP